MADQSSQSKGLGADELRRTIDAKSLKLAPPDTRSWTPALIGQERATDAIRLASAVSHRDFNLFVLGLPVRDRSLMVPFRGKSGHFLLLSPAEHTHHRVIRHLIEIDIVPTDSHELLWRLEANDTVGFAFEN